MFLEKCVVKRQRSSWPKAAVWWSTVSGCQQVITKIDKLRNHTERMFFRSVTARAGHVTQPQITCLLFSRLWGQSSALQKWKEECGVGCQETSWETAYGGCGEMEEEMVFIRKHMTLSACSLPWRQLQI